MPFFNTDPNFRSVPPLREEISGPSPVNPAAYGATPTQMDDINEHLDRLERERQAALAQRAPNATPADLAAALQASVRGQGPSVSNAMYGLNRDQNLQQQAAMMAGGRGALPAVQALAAQNNMAQLGSRAALEAGLGAGNEQFQAQEALFQQAKQQAALEAQQRQLNMKGNFGYLDALQRANEYARHSLMNRQQSDAQRRSDYRNMLAKKYGAQAEAAQQAGGAAAQGAASLAAMIAAMA